MARTRGAGESARRQAGDAVPLPLGTPHRGRCNALLRASLVALGLAVAPTVRGADDRMLAMGTFVEVLPPGSAERRTPLDSGLSFGFPPAEAAARRSATVPRMNEVAGAVGARLVSAFPVAATKVRDVPSCNALFTGLTLDGSQALRQTIYAGATVRQTEGLCSLGVVAFTAVGSPLTRLCPTFAALPQTTAALVLIHEALHYAGMREETVASAGPTPTEISQSVRAACRL